MVAGDVPVIDEDGITRPGAFIAAGMVAYLLTTIGSSVLLSRQERRAASRDTDHRTRDGKRSTRPEQMAHAAWDAVVRDFRDRSA